MKECAILLLREPEVFRGEAFWQTHLVPTSTAHSDSEYFARDSRMQLGLRPFTTDTDTDDFSVHYWKSDTCTDDRHPLPDSSEGLLAASAYPIFKYQNGRVWMLGNGGNDLDSATANDWVIQDDDPDHESQALEIFWIPSFSQAFIARRHGLNFISLQNSCMIANFRSLRSTSSIFERRITLVYFFGLRSAASLQARPPNGEQDGFPAGIYFFEFPGHRYTGHLREWVWDSVPRDETLCTPAQMEALGCMRDEVIHVMAQEELQRLERLNEHFPAAPRCRDERRANSNYGSIFKNRYIDRALNEWKTHSRDIDEDLKDWRQGIMAMKKRLCELGPLSDAVEALSTSKGSTPLNPSRGWQYTCLDAGISVFSPPYQQDCPDIIEATLGTLSPAPVSITGLICRAWELMGETRLDPAPPLEWNRH